MPTFDWLLAISVPLTVICISISPVNNALPVQLNRLVEKYILRPLRLSSKVELYHAPGTRLERIIQSKCPSLYGPSAFYTPNLLLAGSHLPVLFSAFANFSNVDRILYERQYIAVPDGGTLSLDFAPPFDVAPADDRPVLLFIHGLTGGSHESYVRSVMTTCLARGWRGVVVQYRGCGFPAYVTSSTFYHGGATNDPRCALLYLKHLLPNAPVYGVGFSLGANVLSKLVGEDGDATNIKAAVVLSNPFDFWKGHLALESTFLGRQYSKAMAKNLRTVLHRYRNRFEKDPRINWQRIYGNPHQSLYEFDDACTSQLGGFGGAKHYYNTVRCTNNLQDVKIPLLAIHAEHDPITALDAIPLDAFQTNPNLVLATTLHGGHLGWYEGFDSLWTKKRWLNKPVMEFLAAMHEEDPKFRSHPTCPPRLDASRPPQIGDHMIYDTKDRQIGFKLVSAESLVVGGAVAEESTGMMKGF